MSIPHKEQYHEPAATSGSESALQPGTTVHEFRILKLIGEGGFGIVYLAHDQSLDRTVALKEYMPSELAERAGGTTSVQVRSQRHAETFAAGMRSFINEAKLLARFDHPSLLKVYRFFQANGTAYMAMPFYEGQTLKAVLRGLSAPPDEAWLRRVLYQVLDGLEVIHAYDCYHRDIAPDNILMVQSDVPVLLDFGAARRVIADATQQLTVILKPGYAPIEQYAEDPSMKQGPWTDIYALASVVHFALTGKAPLAAVGRALNDQLVPLSQRLRGAYSEGLLTTIDAALSVKPQDRPQSIAAFRARLMATDGEKPAVPIRESHAGVEAIAAEVPSGEPPPAAKRKPYAPSRSSRVPLVGLGLAFVAGVGALWWLMRAVDEQPPIEAREPTASAPVAAPATAPVTAPVPESPRTAPPSRDTPASDPPPSTLVLRDSSPAPPPAAAPAPAPAPKAAPARTDAADTKSAVNSKSAAATPKPAATPPAKVEARPPPSQVVSRTDEPADVAPPAKAPPQQVARAESKSEPAAKADPPKATPEVVARAEPKGAAAAGAVNGRYSGRVVDAGSPIPVTLQILAADDGAVSGTASQGPGRCEGDYRMTGTFRDGSLRMRSTHSGGRYGDCSFGFRATVQGAKLVGQTTTGMPLELSR